jgi:large subunit ribosomal protein L17
LRSEAAVGELFKKIAPQFAQRPGGYTRMLKLGPRVGDGSEEVFLEWLDIALPAKPKKKTAAKEPGQNQP